MMQYNSYFPTGYQPYPQAAQQPQQSQQGQIIWVQGEMGAKAYAVPAGSSALLMDSEENVFYIKTSDVSGMPMPLRIFDYKERSEEPKAEQKFITREEFEERLKELAKRKGVSGKENEGA